MTWQQSIPQHKLDAGLYYIREPTLTLKDTFFPVSKEDLRIHFLFSPNFFAVPRTKNWK